MGIEVKSLRTPEESRPFQGKGKLELVHLGEGSVGRATFEPGWRWSVNIQPIAGTRSCQSSHLGYCERGSMTVRMDDGEAREIKEGDSFAISPGHDAWVTSPGACVMLDFSGFEHYAERGASSTKAAASEQPAVH